MLGPLRGRGRDALPVAFLCAIIRAIIMPNLLIRNVSTRTVAALKERAKRRGRSLQAEALATLETGAGHSGDELADELARLRADGKLVLDLKAALTALREDRSR